MRHTRSAALWYFFFKIVILALLAIDAALYAVFDTPSTAIDAAAWLILLLLFEWETELRGRWRGNWLASAIHVTRIVAILGIGIAAIAFVREDAWLDAVNSALWIAVVVLLEVEMRLPLLVALRPSLFFAMAAALYCALAALVLAWAWRSEWLDAYDAMIWIVAFAIIEMDVLRFSRRSAAQNRSESVGPEP